MKALYYECFSGISGDMNLGALLDLGVSLEYLLAELSKLGLDDSFCLHVKQDSKQGIFGTKVTVEDKTTHEHHHHVHRNFANIKELIENSSLSPFVKEKSIQMFWTLALAEGKIHNKPPQEVHFHEVGAIDSIIDIIGAAICLEALHVKSVLASSVELGGGFVKCAHGTIPVPAPATLEVLSNVPVTLGRVQSETTTPTGAIILKCMVEKFCEKPNFSIQKVGYGIGQKDFEIPNILRVYLIDLPEETFKQEVVLETNLDDMSPEILAYVQEKLFDIGVKDVYTTAITTKKNRLGCKLSVLVSLDKEALATSLIFKETTSLGLRRYLVQKKALQREIKKIETPFGYVNVKCAYYEGEMLKFKAEYEDCKIIALQNNLPIAKVYEIVQEKLKALS